MYSRSTMVSQMIRYLGASQGDVNHRHIVDTYNAHTPLARGYKVKYTDPWCATTVSAAAIECGYTHIIPTECSCTRMIELLKTKGEWNGDDNYVPHPGDIIFFNWDAVSEGQDVDGLAHHVGIVEYVADGKIHTIEGNKDGKCARRTIKIGWKYIHSFGTPFYDEDEEQKPVKERKKYTVQKGDTLSKIGKTTGVWWKDIACINGIKFPYIIYPGEELYLEK